MKTKTKSQRRRARLDTATVVRAAVEFIEAEGLEALSLGRLARQLDVQTPSLYNHIDGLPGLQRELALLSTRDLGERMGNAAIGKSGPDAVLALAEAYRAYVKDHYGLYSTGIRSSGQQTPIDVELQIAQERVVQIALAVVGSFGLQGEEALHAVRGLRSIVHGFAALEVAGGFGLPLDCDESFRQLIRMFVSGLQQTSRYNCSDHQSVRQKNADLLSRRSCLAIYHFPVYFPYTVNRSFNLSMKPFSFCGITSLPSVFASSANSLR
jgi:AcrR family transcriptional regulator